MSRFAIQVFDPKLSKVRGFVKVPETEYIERQYTFNHYVEQALDLFADTHPAIDPDENDVPLLDLDAIFETLADAHKFIFSFVAPLSIRRADMVYRLVDLFELRVLGTCTAGTVTWTTTPIII